MKKWGEANWGVPNMEKKWGVTEGGVTKWGVANGKTMGRCETHPDGSQHGKGRCDEMIRGARHHVAPRRGHLLHADCRAELGRLEPREIGTETDEICVHRGKHAWECPMGVSRGDKTWDKTWDKQRDECDGLFFRLVSCAAARP